MYLNKVTTRLITSEPPTQAREETKKAIKTKKIPETSRNFIISPKRQIFSGSFRTPRIHSLLILQLNHFITAVSKDNI